MNGASPTRETISEELITPARFELLLEKGKEADARKYLPTSLKSCPALLFSLCVSRRCSISIPQTMRLLEMAVPCVKAPVIYIWYLERPECENPSLMAWIHPSVRIPYRV